jgi:hypothetical protein
MVLLVEALVGDEDAGERHLVKWTTSRMPAILLE